MPPPGFGSGKLATRPYAEAEHCDQNLENEGQNLIYQIGEFDNEGTIDEDSGEEEVLETWRVDKDVRLYAQKEEEMLKALKNSK